MPQPMQLISEITEAGDCLVTVTHSLPLPSLVQTNITIRQHHFKISIVFYVNYNLLIYIIFEINEIKAKLTLAVI